MITFINPIILPIAKQKEFTVHFYTVYADTMKIFLKQLLPNSDRRQGFLENFQTNNRWGVYCRGRWCLVRACSICHKKASVALTISRKTFGGLCTFFARARSLFGVRAQERWFWIKFQISGLQNNQFYYENSKTRNSAFKCSFFLLNLRSPISKKSIL